MIETYGVLSLLEKHLETDEAKALLSHRFNLKANLKTEGDCAILENENFMWKYKDDLVAEMKDLGIPFDFEIPEIKECGIAYYAASYRPEHNNIEEQFVEISEPEEEINVESIEKYSDYAIESQI